MVPGHHRGRRRRCGRALVLHGEKKVGDLALQGIDALVALGQASAELGEEPVLLLQAPTLVSEELAQGGHLPAQRRVLWHQGLGVEVPSEIHSVRQHRAAVRGTPKRATGVLSSHPQLQVNSSHM